jgi:hypothetical protein
MMSLVIYVEEWVDPKRDFQSASTCLHQFAGMQMTQKPVACRLRSLIRNDPKPPNTQLQNDPGLHKSGGTINSYRTNVKQKPSQIIYMGAPNGHPCISVTTLRENTIASMIGEGTIPIFEHCVVWKDRSWGLFTIMRKLKCSMLNHSNT